MPLSSGTRVGPYEIVAPLGAGGMGEVYRARDTRLKREVALKILPEAFATDPERMARFRREAEVLASLNHANIATIYGVEGDALVMEVVDGETLRGPLAVPDALRLARQIAEALEYAHERGIIHRDLKPANAKVTPDGAVKLLDFGLAKGIEDPLSAKAADSPTLTFAATRAGIILGTAAYMAPEQAHGKAADRRADIWSFGAVLYEMLTGTQAFTGESVSDTLASVLKLEPDWVALPSETPPSIQALLRRCLTKDRRQRLQAIGEARIAIDDALAGKATEAASSPTTAVRRPMRSATAGWMVAALMTLVAAGATWNWLRAPAPARASIVRFVTPLQLATSNGGIVAGALALSRDGSRLAFLSGPRQEVHVRSMDQFDAHPLPGTEGASFVQFSPDGQSISFVAGNRATSRLKRISIAGGPAQNLADAASIVGPAMQDWATDDTIFYTNNGALMKVRATGGNPETIARPDRGRGEQFFAGPRLLPDGRHLLVSVYVPGIGGGGFRALALDLPTGERKTLIENVGIVHFLPTEASAGHLAYFDSGSSSLMAAPFNWKRLEVQASAAPVVESMQRTSSSPFGAFSISDSGTLVYVGGGNATAGSELVWVDRSGVEHRVGAPPRPYSSGARISPDGRRVTVSILEQTEDVWVYDTTRGTLDRITTEGNSGGAIWTPDGKDLIYERRPSGGPAVLRVPADRSRPPSILATGDNGPIVPASVTPDGKILVGWHALAGKLWTLALDGSTGKLPSPQPFFDAGPQKLNPALSPDGKWIAFRSEETGRPQVYVSTFPTPGGKILISTDSGSLPRWSPDGRELFYRTLDKTMAVEIHTTPEFRAGTPRVVFEGRYAASYDTDGKRFLMIKPPAAQQSGSGQLSVVLDWFAELKRQMPIR